MLLEGINGSKKVEEIIGEVVCVLVFLLFFKKSKSIFLNIHDFFFNFVYFISGEVPSTAHRALDFSYFVRSVALSFEL